MQVTLINGLSRNYRHTSRKINLDFVIDKTVNQADPRLGGVQELIQLYRPIAG